MLLFHKMGTIIDLIGLSEVFFPRSYGHDTASTIVVTGTEKRKEIIGVIQSLPRPHNNIFYKYYVLGMQFKAIAATCNQGESWATTNHGRGLAIVKKILDQMEVTNE